ncbi:MAG: glycosyltransferase family 4 protein [Anaerolineae bacterium]
MRLCYLADPRSTHTRRWLDYFVSRGHEVHLLTVHPYFSPLAGVKAHRILPLPPALKNMQRGHGWLALLFSSWRINSFIRTINPDVLHAHFAKYYGWLAALSGFHPWVLTVWGGDIIADQGAFQLAGKWLTPFSLKKADLVTAVSQHLLGVARQYMNPATDGYVTTIGADLANFNPTVDATAWREQLGLGLQPVVLSPRSFTPLYNIHTIVAAIPHVLAQVPEALFVFKENSSAGWEAYREQIRQMVSDLKVEGAVRYTGEVPYQEMAAFYRLADVVVSVPLSDGLPVTVLEAMACGVPLVLSRLPHLEKLFVDGQNALTVPAQEPQQLAEAIVRLLHDKPLQQQMITNNLALVKAHGDFQAEMQKMEKLYERMAGQG